MFSAEVLSQLRSLNWLTQEIRRVPVGSREAALLQTQMEAVRARLPDSILEYHDRMSAGGKPSAVQVQDEACGGCGGSVPEALRLALALPGRFGVCPHCGVFLWAAEFDGSAMQPDATRAATKAPG
jgi:predicted  nucleic acid-binding Zn-ribbon protein